MFRDLVDADSGSVLSDEPWRHRTGIFLLRLVVESGLIWSWDDAKMRSS